MATGFKVCLKHDGKLYSAFSPRMVEYKIGKKSFPFEGDGPLAVFDSLDTAKEFVGGNYENLEIFECEYTPSCESVLWLRYGVRKNYLARHLQPMGTTLADCVTLKKSAS